MPFITLYIVSYVHMKNFIVYMDMCSKYVHSIITSHIVNVDNIVTYYDKKHLKLRFAQYWLIWMTIKSTVTVLL